MAYTNQGKYFNVAVWVRTHPNQSTMCRLFVHDVWPVEAGGPEAEFGLEDASVHISFFPESFNRNDIVMAEEILFEETTKTLKLYGCFKVGEATNPKEAFEVIASVADPLQHWLRVKTLFRSEDLDLI